MKEEREVSEYEIDYDYDDEHLDISEEEIREKRLPEVVLNFEKVATEYSRGNNVPAIVSFYSILGDLVKYFTIIPFAKTGQDTRIHCLWIQTARTGKSTLIKYVFLPIIEKLKKELVNDKYSNIDIMEINSYTVAGLAGSYRENKDYEVYEKNPERADLELEADLELLLNKRNDGDIDEVEYQKGRVRALKLSERKLQSDYQVNGPLEGDGWAVLDEFHNSGIFAAKKHNEDIISLFQTTMNSIINGGNIWRKKLNDKVGRRLSALQDEQELTLELNSKKTYFMSTYPPKSLGNSIEDAGVIQRPLPFIRDVPEHELESVRSAITLSVGNYDLLEDETGNAEHLADGILEIYKTVKDRFERVNKDMKKVIIWEQGTNIALESERNKMRDFIKHLPIEMRMTLKMFEMNLIEYIAKLATLNCMAMAPSITKGVKTITKTITNEETGEEEEIEERVPETDEDVGRFLLTPLHIRQGGNIVRTCFLALVEWMEVHMSKRRKTLKESPMGKLFQQAYKQAMESALPRQKMTGGFVAKNLVFDIAEKQAGQSRPTINRQFNKLQGNESGKKKEGREDIYQTQKRGKEYFIKPKEE
tara:strand:+ start:1443 stop:3212 length:1770 start_codon:yes stop_codon:yes gene_type:complete